MHLRGNSLILMDYPLTRPLPFSDKRSVPACYHGGNISTLDSDFDVHRSGRNKRFETYKAGNIFLFAGIYC